jgi:hypothetical protein
MLEQWTRTATDASRSTNTSPPPARLQELDTQNKGSIDAADIAGSPGAVERIDRRAEPSSNAWTRPGTVCNEMNFAAAQSPPAWTPQRRQADAG